MCTVLLVLWASVNALFSPETLVATLVQILVAVGATQAVKKLVGVSSLGATLIALLISFIIGLVAFSVSTIAAGNELSFNVVAAEATKVFTLATIAYRVVSPILNNGGSDDDNTPDLGDADAT